MNREQAPERPPASTGFRVWSNSMPSPCAFWSARQVRWSILYGGLAWWLRGAIHIGFLVGLRNRISVMLDWFWAYLTYRSGTRLITAAAKGRRRRGRWRRSS